MPECQSWICTHIQKILNISLSRSTHSNDLEFFSFSVVSAHHSNIIKLRVSPSESYCEYEIMYALLLSVWPNYIFQFFSILEVNQSGKVSVQIQNTNWPLFFPLNTHPAHLWFFGLAWLIELCQARKRLYISDMQKEQLQCAYEVTVAYHLLVPSMPTAHISKWCNLCGLPDHLSTCRLTVHCIAPSACSFSCAIKSETANADGWILKASLITAILFNSIPIQAVTHVVQTSAWRFKRVYTGSCIYHVHSHLLRSSS